MELKIQRMKFKNAKEIINNRMDQAEERICEVEDRNFKIIQSEEKKSKRIKKK